MCPAPQAFPSSPAGTPPVGAASVRSVSGWTVHHYREVASTNLIAAALPAWHVAQADRQTAGRGRFQRSWISDEGGLWISAVVPLATEFPPPLLPLLTGLAVCRALGTLGVGDLRMRWPNDVMVQHRKLAGLLIDRFAPGLAVIGIGINVTNRPEANDPALAGQVVRLADLLSPAPPLDDVLGAVLCHLKAICLEWQQAGPEGLLPAVNGLWRWPGAVELDLDGRIRVGQFEGVDTSGRLQIRGPAGQMEIYEPHQVRLLRELD